MDDSVIEAIQYRINGYVYQRQGDFSRAMECYKKAIEKCPFYACAHNDLGVLYEQKGQIELAEKEYLKATDVEPGYASAYTNLALLYEDVNKLEGACYYWQKRLEVGKSNDVWTLHAKKRFSELSDRLAEQEKAKQAESAKKNSERNR
jgi:Flp pilus assembly protein TadD